MTELNAGGLLPSLEDIMHLRMTQANVIGIYFDKFLSCVVGKCKYQDLVKMQPVKEFAMVTNEAFTLVVLENGWEEWIKIDPDSHFGLKNKQEDGNKHKKVGGGWYTKHAWGATQFCGWNPAGIQRFNELCKIVQDNRECNGDYDVEFYKKKLSMKKENGSKAATNMVVVFDELDV